MPPARKRDPSRDGDDGKGAARRGSRGRASGGQPAWHGDEGVTVIHAHGHQFTVEWSHCDHSDFKMSGSC